MALDEERQQIAEALMFALGENQLSQADALDALAQFDYYVANQATIDVDHAGEYVAIASGTVYSGATIDEAKSAAETGWPGKKYFLRGIAPAEISA